MTAEALSPPGLTVADEIQRMPDAVQEFIQRAIKVSQTALYSEQRTVRRIELGIPVLVRPVDDRHQPTGPFVEMYARNISAGGLGVVFTRAIRDRYVAIQLTTKSGDTLKMIAETVRCRPMGRFYDIGLRFVAKG